MLVDQQQSAVTVIAESLELEAGQQFLVRLSRPWLKEIGEVTGAAKWEVTALGEMVIASSWATLGLWIGGKLSREQTLEALMKGVVSLLQGFGAR